MRDNIKEVAEGRLAIHNDGTVEELREAMKLCFPEDKTIPSGNTEFYECFTVGVWYACSAPNLPTISVKHLIEWTPVRGDVVLVRYNDSSEWESRIFVVNIEGAINSCFCVDSCSENEFNKGKPFRIIHWRKMKRKEVTEMTIEQLEKKYGITNLKIIK